MSKLKTQGFRILKSALRLLENGGRRSRGLSAARRFLFLQYDTALGAAVTVTPIYEALRRAMPNAHIAVACNGISQQVLKYNPNLDQIFVTSDPLKEWRRAAGFFAGKLRRPGFDCVILNSGNRRLRFSLLALLSGARCRLGFEYPGDLNHASISYDPNRSILANNLSLLGLLGHAWKDVEPCIFFSRTEADAIRSFLGEQGISETKPIVALQTQTSGGEPNQWYEDRFVQLADNLHQSQQAQIVFVGTKNENSQINLIRDKMRAPSFSAAGRTDVPRLAALLAMCDLLVTLDTGTMHVGRAVGVPMVVIAPAKNPEHEWLPPSNGHTRVLIRKDIACALCGKTYCATRECMDEIRTDEVMKAVERQLAMFAPSATARSRRISNRLLLKGNEENDVPVSSVADDFEPSAAVSKFRELSQSEFR
jgi:ADP-heptose:LPS heptosyltransferase